jgi:hypothetical protein
MVSIILSKTIGWGFCEIYSISEKNDIEKYLV